MGPPSGLSVTVVAGILACGLCSVCERMRGWRRRCVSEDHVELGVGGVKGESRSYELLSTLLVEIVTCHCSLTATGTNFSREIASSLRVGEWEDKMGRYQEWRWQIREVRSKVEKYHCRNWES